MDTLQSMLMKKGRHNRGLGDLLHALSPGSTQEKAKWNGPTALVKTMPEVSSLLTQAWPQRGKEECKEDRETADESLRVRLSMSLTRVHPSV